MSQESGLVKNSEGKILYAIAIENHRTKFAGMLYVHAKDRNEVVNTLLETKQLKRDSRVVAIAPAVGVWMTETADGKREVIRA
jgi:hypothetical protein